jgi:hypothetical protein
VILRYEIERALIKGELEVDDVRGGLRGLSWGWWGGRWGLLDIERGLPQVCGCFGGRLRRTEQSGRLGGLRHSAPAAASSLQGVIGNRHPNPATATNPQPNPKHTTGPPPQNQAPAHQTATTPAPNPAAPARCRACGTPK